MTDASPAVEVLGAAWCVDTARTLRCLRRLRIPFTATDVDDHLEALQEVTRITGGERRTPVVRIGQQVLVEPPNTELVQALETAGLLAPSTVLAFEHGQNVGDLERVLRLIGAGLAIAATADTPAAVRVPIRGLAVGLALTAVVGWCPVYDARGVTSVGGPGDHPDEAERDSWLAPTRPAGPPNPWRQRADPSLEPRS
jgi:glutaredoxin